MRACAHLPSLSSMPNTVQSSGAKPIVLAYSGGLDTSFLVPWVAENYGRPIITVTVDTGGIDAAAARTLEERAKALGAVEHHLVDARADYFEQVLRFLIMGNVRRGQLYPLCVGAERVMQAQTIARMARELGTSMIAHGCTAAGNDQVRFEVALRTLAPDLEVLAPVRDKAFKRQDELEYLQKRNLPVPPHRRGVLDQSRPVGRDHRRQGDADLVGQHSRQRVGAVEGCVHESAQRRSATSSRSRRAGRSKLDGKALSPVELIETLESLGGAVRHRPRHPSGRHHHRHQGPRGVRSAGGGNAAHRASRAREARAHAAPAAHQGTGRAALRRPRARRPAAGPGVPRHRSAAAVLAGARHRRCARAVPPGKSVRRRRRVAVLADGRLERRVRRSRGRMDRDGRARVFEDRRAHRRVPPARRRAGCRRRV